MFYFSGNLGPRKGKDWRWVTNYKCSLSWNQYTNNLSLPTNNIYSAHQAYSEVVKHNKKSPSNDKKLGPCLVQENSHITQRDGSSSRATEMKSSGEKGVDFYFTAVS